MITEVLLGILEDRIARHGEAAVKAALGAIGNVCLCPAETPAPMSPAITTAWALTHGDRRAAYGTPQVVFTGYAKMWSGLLATKLKADLTAADVALMMTALKLAREANAHQADNTVDAHGYLIMHEEIVG